MEDISKEFNIDKNKGNEFFYEQTKIDEDLFLSTLAINQSEVKLENQAQNFLIQKIANLAQTGDDSISFKRVMDRINRRQLDEVGTERSREKPINVIARNIQELTNEKENLEKYKNFKYEFEEKESTLNNEIFNLENEKNFSRRKGGIPQRTDGRGSAPLRQNGTLFPARTGRIYRIPPLYRGRRDHPAHHIALAAHGHIPARHRRAFENERA